MSDIKPSHTIFIKNLYTKIKKTELRKSLYTLFSQFGSIINVLCYRTDQMRSKAHITFKEIGAATTALRSMQGFPFYDRAMTIQFSKEDSDIIAKAKGTYVERPKNVPRIADLKQKKPTTRKPANSVSAKEPTFTSTAALNKILYCSNLTSGTGKNNLQILFSQFPGLQDIRLVPGRSDIAFVEFENETLASTAKEGLNSFKVSPDQPMKVDFANK
ncbi:hypothetical protein L596_016893 [Steinernema carpocapsae]|uniref:RRM domain-containing protein n=1 Tax=Steinernema carpocapsae TaxID=34508 RepID=A0A4U5NKK5_STECR|nr:hypothetical protein L596_016893 [Steinernema carpocapsae]